jgi:hypothetical protein
MAGIALVVLTLTHLAGCGSRASQSDSLTPLVEEYAQLPGLRGSTHPGLQQAWHELEVAHQLPSQEQAPSVAEPYKAIAEAYPSFTRVSLQREVGEIWPADGFQFAPGALERAREIVASQAAARKRFARAAQSISPQPQLTNRASLLEDEAWLDAAYVGCRLEGLAAAEALAEGAPHEATFNLELMLRVSAQLARESHVNARLTAIAMRREVMQVLSAIANHPAISQGSLTHLQQVLTRHTADWPTDDRIWSAERARGLLIYELVRDGHYLEQLPHEERAELERLGLLTATGVAALKDVDADEAFYLRAMQLQIAAAQLPFFQRADSLAQLETELETRKEASDFPLLAGSLLLPDAAAIHRRLAEDRCRCEAWLIALAAANSQQLGPLPVCSLTGQPYELQADGDQVALNAPGLPENEPIRIRRLGVLQAQRRAAGFDLR